jgi:caspase domain-containing protein
MRLLVIALLMLMSGAASADGAAFFAGAGENMLTPRHALVIGVKDYTALDPLNNTRNDAGKVYAILKSVGFSDARLLTDLETDGGPDTRQTQRGTIYTALGDLSRAARQDGGVIFIYFAGHGLTYQNETYLLPSDAVISEPDDVKHFGIPMSDIFDKIKTANATEAIVIVDACRNNPFGRQPVPDGVSLYPVLPEDPPLKTAAFFSTVKGDTAPDGDGEDSPFAKVLLSFLNSPDRPLDLVLSDVRQSFVEADKVPILNIRTYGEFVLMSTEEEFRKQSLKWAQTSKDNTPVEYDGFVREFPGGYFERAARKMLNQSAQDAQIAATRRATAPILATNLLAQQGAVLYANPFAKNGAHTPLLAGEHISALGKSGVYLWVVRDRDGKNGYVLEKMTKPAPSNNVNVAFDVQNATPAGDGKSIVDSFLSTYVPGSFITVQSVLPSGEPASSSVGAHEAAHSVVKFLTDAGIPRSSIQVAPVYVGGTAPTIVIKNASGP